MRIGCLFDRPLIVKQTNKFTLQRYGENVCDGRGDYHGNVIIEAYTPAYSDKELCLFF